jgi:hypothetical protein
MLLNDQAKENGMSEACNTVHTLRYYEIASCFKINVYMLLYALSTKSSEK